MRAVQLSSAFFLVLAVLNTETSTVTAIACADRVSSGDESIGISAVEDASCVSGGLGCFPYGDQCRFCRMPDTQLDHLELCSEIQTSSTTESAPAKTTKTPSTKPPEESAIDCLSLVSVGDQGVGIFAVAATNPTCAANGLGCFQSGQCRFCQSRSTIQSAPFLKCSDVGGSSTATSTPSTASPTSAPAYTPSPTVASTSTTCSSVVSRSGLDGISYVSESRCNVASPTLLGCSARTACRLCRNYKNEANQYLISCKVLKDQGATESAMAASSSTGTTDSVAVGSSAPDTIVRSSGMLKVSTATDGSVVNKAAGTSAPIAAAAAVVAVLVVVMMSVIYVKGHRDPYDEPMTPDDCPDGDLMTPHGGHGYTPREGSLVMVVSQSSIATL